MYNNEIKRLVNHCEIYLSAYNDAKAASNEFAAFYHMQKLVNMITQIEKILYLADAAVLPEYMVEPTLRERADFFIRLIEV